MSLPLKQGRRPRAEDACVAAARRTRTPAVRQPWKERFRGRRSRPGYRLDCRLVDPHRDWLTVYNLPLMKTTPLLSSILLLVLCLMNLPVHAEKPAFVADTIIVNAVVHTMDPAQPTAEAVAIYANRIIAVGSSKDIRQLAG